MFKLRRVVGDSMLPDLPQGGIILTKRLKRQVRIGDVIIVSHDRMEKLKRVTGVRHDEIFVEGDNAADSTDSRHFGWLPASTIQGRVIWPRTTPHR